MKITISSDSAAPNTIESDAGAADVIISVRRAVTSAVTSPTTSSKPITSTLCVLIVFR